MWSCLPSCRWGLHGDTAVLQGHCGPSQSPNGCRVVLWGWGRSRWQGPMPVPMWMCCPQALDGDLYERLRDHLSTAGRAEVESCEITQDWFQRISEAATQVLPPIPSLC